MTTAVMMKREQWSLLNLLHRRMLFTGSRRASGLVIATGASRDDVAELEAAGLIEWVWISQPTGAQRLADVPMAALTNIQLRLSPAGQVWRRTDPHNRVLSAACSQISAPSLCRVFVKYELDPAAVVALVDAGLVVVEHGVTGAPLYPVTVAAVRGIVADGQRDWLLSPTRRGATVMFP